MADIKRPESYRIGYRDGRDGRPNGNPYVGTNRTGSAKRAHENYERGYSKGRADRRPAECAAEEN